MRALQTLSSDPAAGRAYNRIGRACVAHTTIGAVEMAQEALRKLENLRCAALLTSQHAPCRCSHPAF